MYTKQLLFIAFVSVNAVTPW